MPMSTSSPQKAKYGKGGVAEYLIEVEYKIPNFAALSPHAQKVLILYKFFNPAGVST